MWTSQQFAKHHAKLKRSMPCKECARREQEASCGVEAFRPSSSVLASYPDEIVFIIGQSGMANHSANNAVVSDPKHVAIAHAWLRHCRASYRYVFAPGYR
jgi:hypothetical protein